MGKGLTSAYRNSNAAWCDPEALVDFVTVTSDFYLELQAYYEGWRWSGVSFQPERAT